MRGLIYLCFIFRTAQHCITWLIDFAAWYTNESTSNLLWSSLCILFLFPSALCVWLKSEIYVMLLIYWIIVLYSYFESSIFLRIYQIIIIIVGVFAFCHFGCAYSVYIFYIINTVFHFYNYYITKYPVYHIS